MDTGLDGESALCGKDHASSGPRNEWEGLPRGCTGEGVRGALSDGDNGRKGGNGWRN